MADIDRQTEEHAENRRAAEQKAEQEIARKRSEVLPDVVGDAPHAVFAEEALGPVELQDALRHAVVGGVVVEIAVDQAGEEQADAGDGGVEDGAAGDQALLFEQVRRFLDVDEVRAAGHEDEIANQPGERHGDADVAEDGDELAAHRARDQAGELFGVAQLAARLADRRRDGVGRHRRLLGRHGAVQDVDQAETEAVVQAVGEGGRERRHRRLG